MNDRERIEALSRYTGLNLKRLAEEIGLKTHQTLYDIRKGKHGISKDLAEKIQAKYLNINIGWLLTGDGEMIKPAVTQNNENGDNINGHSVTINKTEGDYLEIIKSLTAQLAVSQQQVSVSQEQMNRLIIIIENKL